MKKLCICFILLTSYILNAQTVSDLFRHSDVKISWLGVDFSHVKLIGNFAEFSDAGEKSTLQIRDKYFPNWNRLILDEPTRYDLKGMLRKDNLYIDIDDVTKLNAKTHLEEMESYNVPNYTAKQIADFVKEYNTQGKEGLGVVFIAEALNKTVNEAYFHFVVINMKTKEVLIAERLMSKPAGVGLRNFWAGAIHRTMKEIRDSRYMVWRKKYAAEK